MRIDLYKLLYKNIHNQYYPIISTKLITFSIKDLFLKYCIRFFSNPFTKHYIEIANYESYHKKEERYNTHSFCTTHKFYNLPIMNENKDVEIDPKKYIINLVYGPNTKNKDFKKLQFFRLNNISSISDEIHMNPTILCIKKSSNNLFKDNNYYGYKVSWKNIFNELVINTRRTIMTYDNYDKILLYNVAVLDSNNYNSYSQSINTDFGDINSQICRFLNKLYSEIAVSKNKLEKIYHKKIFNYRLDRKYSLCYYDNGGTQHYVTSKIYPNVNKSGLTICYLHL